jgi:hypothetical protein
VRGPKRHCPADAQALTRRFSILEQASLILGSARRFDEVFRDLARLLVPTLADWGAIHLAGEDGVLRFVAGAHRDASRTSSGARRYGPAPAVRPDRARAAG